MADWVKPTKKKIMANIFRAKSLISRTGVFSNEVLSPNLIYNTGDQNISGIKNFTNNLVLQDNLLQSSQASGYLTGIGYSGNYDGGYFLGRTKLSQNASRLVDSSFGNNWIAKESIRTWYSVSISSNGKYQTAVDYGGKIYISSDYGNSWVAKESNRSWFGVAMSSDGKYQTVIINGGLGTAGIYVSINYGNTWTAKESNRFWYGVDMSSDGKYQTAVVNGGQIYISSDYGKTWVAKESNRNWGKVSMSSDGKYQTAVHYGGKIYISSDYGNTWVAKESNTNWNSISMSSDGKYQTAGVYVGKIYISSNYGNTWFAKESNRGWNSISMSSDGKYQTAVADGGYIYVSKTDELIDGNLYVDNFYATSGFFSGTLNASNLVYNTGNQTISGVKNFASRPTVNGTGVLLSGEAASLPITIVYTTGDQIISGIKTFAENTTFGDTGQGDFLVISGNNFTVYGSGNFTSGLFVNGNAVLTGVDLSSYATTVNLITTGSTLDTKINILSGSSVLLYGDQNISGNKTFINNITVSGTGTFNAIDLDNIDNLSVSGVDVTLTNSIVNVAGNIFISGNPVLTGVDLTPYATTANLATTGSTLDSKIGSLSGTLTSTYATITNLASTGSNLNTQIENTKKLAIAYAIAL